MSPLPVHTVEYSDKAKPVYWRGRHVSDVSAFRKYAELRALPRLRDDEDAADLQADLDALASTEYATEFLRTLLSAEIEPKTWELGEALGEMLLADEHGIRWPWNHARDKCTPKASLPGIIPNPLENRLRLHDYAGEDDRR
jgi:hypothetical protein